MSGARLSLLFPFLLAGPASPAADPSGRSVPPSRAKVNPLAVEWQLLGELARSRAAPLEELEKRGAYLKELAGAGYQVVAVHPDRDPSLRQLKMRQAAYAALAAIPLRDASRRVERLYAETRIRVSPAARSGRAPNPSSGVEAYLAGVRGEVATREQQIETLRKSQALDFRRSDPRHGAAVDAQVDTIRKQIDRLKALGKDLEESKKALARYDPLAEEIQRLAEKESRAAETDALEVRAAKLAESRADVLAAAGVGTHQVRLTVDGGTRARIEQAIAARLGEEDRGGRAKLRFIRGKLDFLPSFWPEPKKEGTAEGFRVTEYLSGDEVFLTIFDGPGIWYRITVLETGGTLHVLVP